MADLRRMHIAISKGMKLCCTVEEALEDVIVVSLKYKTKEFRGILLDSSQRHLPPGLTFPKEGDPAPNDGATTGNSNADGAEHLIRGDFMGVTLACRYSYNHDPAKYNEQPLPAHPSISIRSARSKTVRNIRLRPRQTLCSKCKSLIHDSKSKSPSKAQKTEGEGQQGEQNYHNTRFRAAQSGKTPDANTAEPMLTRSGLRNKRLEESNPKVLLENIRPKREVRSTTKRKTSPDAYAGQKSKSGENSGRKVGQQQDGDSPDSVSQSSRSAGDGRIDSDLPKYGEENSRIMVERSVSLDNSTTMNQYNRQPVVRLEKSLMSSSRMEEKTTERIPTLQIANIPRPSPAIKISYGDGAVLKIPPRLPGAELKSPDGHSTADESPVPNSPTPDPLPAKKIKKASRKSRDKQRYRIVNDSEISSEPLLPGIKIASHHRKHKRKHRHRHNSEDENFNSESGQQPPSKFPAIIAKFSRVHPVNDMNGNEQKNDPDILKEDSQSQQESIFEKTERSPSVSDFTQTDDQTRTEDDQIFDEDPLRIEGLPIPENVYSDQADSRHQNSCLKASECTSLKTFDFDDAKENKVFPGVSRESPAGSESKSIDIWGSPVKIETPAFEIGGSPARIEVPPFPTDDSQDALEIQPLSVKDSPEQQNDGGMESSASSPPAWIEEEEKREEAPDTDEEERKEPVPYGTGMFEDLTPDEDEDDHDDRNVSQPMYQLPLGKKPRLLYAWQQEEQSAPHHLSSMATYYSKNPARVITDSPSSLYPKGSRAYQNGPASYFPSGSSSTSVFANSPAPAFPNSPAGVFQNSPAPRIQNSPTPIIHKSPVPIFQYSGSSRYQGSPGRRYVSSPSRRYHVVGDSSGRYSATESSALQRTSSRYHSHGHIETEPPSGFRTPVESLPTSDFRLPKGSDTGHSAAHFQTKFEGRSAVRYSPLTENSATRFQPPSENSATKVSISDDNSSVATSARYPSLGENSSSARFPSSAERGSLSVYPVQNVGSATQKYFQGSGSSALSPGFPRQPLGEGSLPAHSHTQYKTLTSSDSRFQAQSDERFPTVAGLPSPLSVNRTPTAAHRSDSDSKVVPQPLVSRFTDPASGSASAGVFLSQTSAPVQAHGSSLPGFHSKQSAAPIPERSISVVEASKPLVGVSGSAPSQDAASAFFDHKRDPSLGVGGVFRTRGQSGLVLGRGQSASSVSQSQAHFIGGTTAVSDSDDDESDNGVPGFPSNSGQLPGHIEGDGSRPLTMKIQTQSLTKCYNSRGREIRVGDVVWGKVQGFPWWPACITSITVTQRDHRDQDRIVTQICHVSWFGSSTMSYMSSADLHPFVEDFTVRHNKKKRGPYRVAIQQALQASQTISSQQADAEPLQTLNLQDLVA